MSENSSEFDQKTNELIAEVESQAQGAFGQQAIIRSYIPMIKSNFYVMQAIEKFSASTSRTEKIMVVLAGAQIVLAIVQTVALFWK